MPKFPQEAGTGLDLWEAVHRNHQAAAASSLSFSGEAIRPAVTSSISRVWSDEGRRWEKFTPPCHLMPLPNIDAERPIVKHSMKYCLFKGDPVPGPCRQQTKSNL